MCVVCVCGVCVCGGCVRVCRYRSSSRMMSIACTVCSSHRRDRLFLSNLKKVQCYCGQQRRVRRKRRKGGAHLSSLNSIFLASWRRLWSGLRYLLSTGKLSSSLSVRITRVKEMDTHTHTHRCMYPCSVSCRCSCKPVCQRDQPVPH